MRWDRGSQMTPKMRIPLIKLLGKFPTSVFCYMGAWKWKAWWLSSSWGMELDVCLKDLSYFAHLCFTLYRTCITRQSHGFLTVDMFLPLLITNSDSPHSGRKANSVLRQLENVQTLGFALFNRPEWYGMLYSQADSKKKSNLMMSLFEPGPEPLPWLGKMAQLGPISGTGHVHWGNFGIEHFLAWITLPDLTH